MDIEMYERKKDASQAAKDTPMKENNIVRIEVTQEADDGQQYEIMLLDADDSFDVVVKYPNTEREIVWSLVRERAGQ